MKKYISYGLVGSLLIGVFLTTAPAEAVIAVPPPGERETKCYTFVYQLRQGSRDRNTNGEVTRLQEFLIAKGYLSVSPTGYYGSLTAQAVRNYQRDNGLSQAGEIGPQTRARIKLKTCTTAVTSPVVTSLSTYAAPVETRVTIYGTNFTASNNTIIFGGGIIPNVSASANLKSLTFVVPSLISAPCLYVNPPCMLAAQQVVPGSYQIAVQNVNGTSNYVNFTVTSSTTSEAPVIYSIAPSQGPHGTKVTVYGKNFTRTGNAVNFAGATRTVTNIPSFDGTTLEFNVPGTPCSEGMYCAQVLIQAGTYPLSISNTYGTSNATNFTITSEQNINQTFSLAVGGTYSLNSNFSVKVLSVKEDSRCPLGATCIQAGRVVIETSIRSYDMIQTVNLSTEASAQYQNSVSVDGYRVRLVDVSRGDSKVVTFQLTK